MPQLYKNTVKSSWRNVKFEDQDLRRKWYERNKDKIADNFPEFKKEKYNAEGQFENDNLEALYRNSRFDEKANKAGEEYSFLKNQLTPEQKQQIYTQYNGDLNSFLKDSFGSDYINNERLKGREALANGQFRGVSGLARLVSMSPEARDEVRNILKMSADDTTENDDELFNASQFAQDRSILKRQKQEELKRQKEQASILKESADIVSLNNEIQDNQTITQDQYEKILTDALPTDRRQAFKDRYNNEIKPKIDKAINDIVEEASLPGNRMPDIGTLNKMACERVAEELNDSTLKQIANDFLSSGKRKHMDAVYARIADQKFMNRPGAQVRQDAADKFLLTGTLSDRLEQVPEGNRAQYVKDFFDEQKAKSRLSPDTRKEMFKKEFLEAYDNNVEPEDIFKNSGLELKENKVLETIQDVSTSIGGSIISHLLPIKISPTTIYAGKKLYDKLVLKDKLSEQYAEEKEKQWQRDHTIIPEKENRFKDVDTVDEFKYAINELSPTYSEWNGSNWMPLTETDYENMFQEVEPLLKKGQIDSATWAIDEYLNDIIGEHQEYLHPDNKGHHGKINSSFRQSGAMALETASYYATSLPSLLWGMAEAVVDPSEMQLDAGYNWWERSMYNTIHNDWLGVLSNTSVHELANDIQENADVYGDDFRAMVLKALPSISASVTNGAGMLVDVALTRGAATLGKAALNSLSRNAIKAATRAEAKKLISEGAKEQLKLYTKKIAENTPLLKANYAEAVQQGIETEETIHKQANELKKSVVSQIIAEHVDDFANDTENRYPYTMDDIDAAIMQLPKQQQQRFMNAVNGDPGLLSQQERNDLVTTAKAIHAFNELVPDFDERVDVVAGLESMTETQIATAVLFATDKLLGGVDKNFLNGALGKKIFSTKALKDRLDLSKGLGKWAAEKFGTKEGLKSFGKAAFNTSKTMLSEAFTEVGQQSYSALGQQFGENSIESFLANHLYGDGSAMVGDLTYDFLSEINKDRFLHDAALGETVKETLFSTFITPSFGRRGKIKPTKRREGQSWLNNAIQQVHYYNPINLQMANEMFNDMAMAGQADAFVNSINKFFNDPKNKANVNGTIATTNYALEMMKDVITDDDFKFGNDQLSKNIAEAIAMSYAPNDATVQNRRQLIKNMASIKSATPEEKQQAIDGFRKEMQSNPAVEQMTDEQILDQLEEAGNRVDKIYEGVFAEQNRLDEIYGKDRNNWQRRSGMIFGKLMQQHLQEKLDDYKKTINDVAEQVKDKDLGQTTANLSEIDWSKDKPKFEGTISGHDILRLAPANIAKMLDPKRLKDYSEEQQKIIKDTNQALLSADPEKKIVSAVNNYGRAITQSLKLSKEYDKLIADETWTSKKIDKTSKEINAISERYSKLGLNMTMRTYADRLNATLGHAGQTAKILSEAKRELGSKKYEEFINKVTQGFRLQGLEGNDTFLDAVKINDAAEQMKSIMGELCDAFANKSNMMIEVERLIDNRVENATSYDKFLNLDNFNTGNPIVNAMFRTAIMTIKDGAQSEVPSSTTNTYNEKSVGTTQPKENVLENTPKQPEKTDGNIINENIDRIINAGHTTENLVEAIVTLGKASNLTNVDKAKEKALRDYIISYFDSTENFIVSFSNEFSNGTMSFDDYKNNINDLFTELFNIQRSVLDFFNEGDDIYDKSSALYNFIEEQKRKVNNWQAQNEATTEESKKENTEEKKPKERKITARMKESSARKTAERLAKEIQKQKGSNKSWSEITNSLAEKFWDKSNSIYQPLKDLFVDRELFETFLKYSNPDNIEQKLNDLFSSINFESEEEQVRNTKKRSKSFEEFKTEIEDTEEFELLQDLRGTLKNVIIYDNTGDLRDLNRKYIIHPKTKGDQLEKSRELNELRSTRNLNGKELISFDNLLERLKKTVASHRGIDASHLDINDIRNAVIDLINEGKTTAQYIREKYNEYIENEIQLDIQRTDEYDRMVRTGLIDELNQLYAEEDAFKQQYEGVELPDDFWITEEKRKEEKPLYEVHVSFPNSSTIYTYYTENPNVKPDMKFTVTTSTGNKRQITVRSVSEANRNELQWNESERSFSKGDRSFFMLEDRAEKSEAQQRQEVKHDVENLKVQKQGKETSIIQSQMDRANAKKEPIQESHEMPINVLHDSGAHDFLDKGGLHPNDKLGFVIGQWFDRGRPRRVIYVVTEQTYENGSNNIELFGQKNFFGGHQVVDVLDTDSWTEDSYVQIINKAAEGRNLGEYFTIENNSLVITEVNNRGILSSNVKESNEEIQERQLNNILDVDESGNYGRMYEGKMKPVVIVKFQNGSAMASDASFDTGKFVQSKQYETTSSGDFINNASVIVIDSPSGSRSTLVYNRTRKESGKPDSEFDGIIGNAIRGGKIGEVVKKMVVDHVDAIGRNQKHSFSLGKIFKLKSGGISISLNKATKTIDISHANIADNKFNVIANISPFNSDGTERSFDDITNDVYNALISYLLDNNIIDGSNIGITKDSNVYEEYPELLNAQISDGLLYCPKVELDSNGKMCLESTTYIAKFEKGPESNRATKRGKEQKPTITPKTIETTPEIVEKPDETIDVSNSSADDVNIVNWQKSEKGSKYKRNKAKTGKKQGAVESMQQEMFNEVKVEHPNDSDMDNQQRANCE